MKHEAATLHTKKALAAALKQRMEHKPLSKITVSEIAADCGLNRKTFYYHFPDIYSLLKWMLEQEAVEVVRQFDLLIDYQDAILFVINYVEDNAHILNCAYDSMGREEMKRFFYNDLIGIMRTAVEQAERELVLRVAADFKSFLCNLCTEALAGMLINRFQHPDEYSKEQVLEYLSLILRSTLPAVLKNAPKEPPEQGIGTP